MQDDLYIRAPAFGIPEHAVIQRRVAPLRRGIERTAGTPAVVVPGDRPALPGNEHDRRIRRPCPVCDGGTEVEPDPVVAVAVRLRGGVRLHAERNRAVAVDRIAVHERALVIVHGPVERDVIIFPRQPEIVFLPVPRVFEGVERFGQNGIGDRSGGRAARPEKHARQAACRKQKRKRRDRKTFDCVLFHDFSLSDYFKNPLRA